MTTKSDYQRMIDHAHTHLFASFSTQLAQTNCRGQTRRAGPHNDHIELHRFAFHPPILCHLENPLIVYCNPNHEVLPFRAFSGNAVHVDME